MKKKYGAEEFDSFSKYTQRFSKTFGFKSEKALILFAQTVGIKVLGNLNEFIRSNMLEENDAEAAFSGLRELYNNLLSAHKAIEKAREQANLLQPIVENSKVYAQNVQELNEIELLQSQSLHFFAQQKANLYSVAGQELEHDILRKTNQVENNRLIINELSLQRDELNIAVSSNKVYEQLKQLERNIQQSEEEAKRRQQRASVYQKLAQALDWKTEVSEKQFYQYLEDAQKQILQGDEEMHVLEEKEYEIKREYDELRNVLSQQKEELNSLLQRKNRLPIEQVNIRQKIVKKLHVSENELPFVAELLKVNDESWERAIENLLRPLGLTLLVKPEYIEDITKYVHQNNLEGKISYEVMPIKNRATERGKKMPKHDILNKLEVKNGTDFTTFLEVYLLENYNFKCVGTISDLQHCDFAVTEKALIKNNNRYEKDDTHEVDPAKNFILGWDNRPTILAMQQAVKATEGVVARPKSPNSAVENGTR